MPFGGYVGEDENNIFLKLARFGRSMLRGKGPRKLSVYADLKDGSIRDRMFYGDMEVFSANAGRQNTLRKHVLALIGKGDMQILLSPQYSAICSIMAKDPENTVKELREIADETAESREIVKKLLRKFSHSKDEVVRTYAFNEL